MDVHEYQAKELLSNFGVPIPRGGLAYSPEQAVYRAREIGGPQESEAAAFIRDRMTKPVVAYVAGLTAPKGRRMGHAGAIISAFGESAGEKVSILREAGVIVAPTPSDIGSTVAALFAKAA